MLNVMSREERIQEKTEQRPNCCNIGCEKKVHLIDSFFKKSSK